MTTKEYTISAKTLGTIGAKYQNGMKLGFTVRRTASMFFTVTDFFLRRIPNIALIVRVVFNRSWSIRVRISFCLNFRP